MDSYDERIMSFADGKQLQRLRQPVRSGGDGFCDACGSPQASTLYGLRDKASDRVFFVGATCLKELSRKGVVVRPFGKQSATVAYDKEMQLRHELSASDSSEEVVIEQRPTLLAQDQNSEVPDDALAYSPAVIAYETAGHYHAIVTLTSSAAQILSVGSAVEERVTDAVKESTPEAYEIHQPNHSGRDALVRCVLQAWEQAMDKLNVNQETASEPVTRSLGETLLVEVGSGSKNGNN